MAAMKPLMRLINQSPAYMIAAPNETIHFVASRDTWAYCESRLRAATIMGLDTETKPVFTKGAKLNPCSLLQIATRDALGKEEVFIIDLLLLQPKIYNRALSDVFLSKRIVKLGQGFYQDLRELAESYPRATCFRVAKRVVEVNDLSIALVGGVHLPLSLQKLVFLYLHRKLTKTQQTSNWNRRPLAASQLHYAAADALVLLHVYDEIMARIAHTQPSFAIDTVAQVLDVHVLPPPKCSLCSSAFATAAELKTHRRECTVRVHTLEICNSCDEKKLVTADEMAQHVSECSSEVGSDNTNCVAVKLLPKAPVVAVAVVAPFRKRSRSVPDESAATAAVNASKKAIAKQAVTPTVTPTVKPTVKQTAKQTAKQTTKQTDKQTTKQTAKPTVKAAALPNKTGCVEDALHEQCRLSKGQKKAQRKAQRKSGSVTQLLTSTAELALATSRTAAKVTPQSSTVTDADAAETRRVQKKLRKKQRRIAEATAASTVTAAASILSKKPLKRRKMSVESSLLASDAMWSKVSSDHSTSMFSP